MAHEHLEHQGQAHADPATAPGFKDPVCGMTVGPDSRLERFEGTEYHFCSQKCLDKFRLSPRQYLVSKPPQPDVASTPGTIYTCPMHPEIRQNLMFALAYNALGIPLAAGLLYPVTGWLLSPMIAALAMSLSSVSMVGNALRLRTVKL